MSVTFYDDSDTASGISWGPGWTHYAPDYNYRGTTYTQRTTLNLPRDGIHADFLFSGASSFAIVGGSWFDHGRYFCQLVDTPSEPWRWYNASIDTPAVTYNLTLCAISGLASSSHTVDYYTLDTVTSYGSSLNWSSDFPTVSAAPSLANLSTGVTKSSTTKSGTSVSSSTSSSTGAAGTSAAANSSTSKVPLGVGIGVGLAAVVVLISILAWYLRRTSAKRRFLAGGMEMREHVGTTPAPSSTAGEGTADGSGFHYQSVPAVVPELYAEELGGSVESMPGYGGPYGGKYSTSEHGLPHAASAASLEDPRAFAPR